MGYEEKPWLKSYKLGPYKLKHSMAPYPEVPLFDALDRAAEKYPGKPAIRFEGRTINYRTLKEYADRIAAALASMGLQKGDRVSLFLPNCPEFIIFDWGLLKAGCAAVPISTLRPEEGLLHEAGSSGSRVIVCREEDLEKVVTVKAQCDIERIVVTSTAGFDQQGVSCTLPEDAVEFRTLLDDYPPKPPAVQIDSKEDLCELAFTGGSTGIPKGVMTTHYNRHCNLIQSLPWLLAPLAPGVVGKASFMVPVPLFHAFGHFLVQMGAYWGLRLLLMPDARDIEAIVQTIREHRPFLIPAVPTQLMRMCGHKIGRLNAMILTGTAPLPDEVRAAVAKEIGLPVGEGYGLTETGPNTHLNPSGFGRITGFMAKEKKGLGIPVPDTDCKIVDPATGQEVPFGETGEIVVRGPQIMKGYWPTKGEGLAEEGWLHTGDIGHMDEEGYFFISDRIKDMVNVSGLKVYTTTVDEVLYRHPAVMMAAAFGVPDPQNPGSERVMAVLKLKDEAKGKITPEEIQAFCREHLAPYAVPKYVEIKEDMPVTVTEKLFKRALREEAIERMKERGEVSAL